MTTPSSTANDILHSFQHSFQVKIEKGVLNTMQLNDTLYGFTVRSIRELSEINARMVEMVYEKNGARLIWLDRDDTNMTFAITFKTVPDNHTGVFHILEHSVLNGSDKFPLKEPFVNLLKSSLQTYLNAMTFVDKTMYPVASRNRKDFLNLVDVYMDAVLHPAIYHRPNTFRQEGWHYEWAEDGSLTRSGVVYSEMKGAYTSVDTQLGAHLSRLLYPDTCYQYDSGGAPEHIPELSYEQFLDYHRRFYHPSNSYIILDGQVCLDEILPLLDSYLCAYGPSDAPAAEIPAQGTITPAFYQDRYEVQPDEPTEHRAQAMMGYVYGTYDQPEKALAMEVLGDVLCGTNEAPLRKAIQEQGLAENISFSGGSEDAMRYLQATVTVKNTDGDKLGEVEETIRRVLTELCDRGIDRKELIASINSLEFTLKERDFGTTPKGLVFAISMMDTWLHGGDPAQNLCYGDRFDRLRAMADQGYFEDLLRTALLDNPHRATVLLTPSADCGEERRRNDAARLAAIADGWDQEKKDAIAREAQELLAAQQAEDTPEQLATLPMLKLSDVNDQPEKLLLEKTELEGRTLLLSKADTAGILYADLYFDAADLTEDELSAASFLSGLMCDMPTEDHTTAQLQTALKTHVGAFGCCMEAYGPVGKVAECTPYLVVNISVLEQKRHEAARLCEEILSHTLFTDAQRMGQILRQKKLSLREGIMESGSSYAACRVSACFTAKGVIAEHTAGITQYQWLLRAEEALEADPEAFCRSMAALAKRLFTRERLTLSITGHCPGDWGTELLHSVPSDGQVVTARRYAPFGVRHDGVVISSDISFTAQGANVYALGSAYGGQMSVAALLLTYNYLWNVIRVQNGAYGAGMAVGDLGDLRYTTYRDPNAPNSLETFAASGAYLRENLPDAAELESLIIGAVGESEPIRTPRSRGKLAAVCYFMGVDDERLRRHRREMLSAHREDLLRFGALLDELNAHSACCVIGSRALVEKCGDKLENIITLA